MDKATILDWFYAANYRECIPADLYKGFWDAWQHLETMEVVESDPVSSDAKLEILDNLDALIYRECIPADLYKGLIESYDYIDKYMQDAQAPPVVEITITTQPSDQSVTVGTGAEFSVVASGNTGTTLTYRWQNQLSGTAWSNLSDDGTVDDPEYIIGSQTNELGIKSASAETITLRCQITGTNGSTTDTVFTNTVTYTATAEETGGDD